MERVFTEDHGRYSRGEVRDYPLGTWRDFFPDYQIYTKPVEDLVTGATYPGSRPGDVASGKPYMPRKTQKRGPE